MAALLAAMPFPFERIRALDVVTDRDRLVGAFDRHDGSTATDVEMMICLSHIAAWTRFVESGGPAALFLEDDVHFSDNFVSVLGGLAVDPAEEAIWRLETFLATVTATRRPAQRLERAAVYELHTNHAGAAAYVLSRRMAVRLLEQRRSLRRVIDTELFDPERRSIVAPKVYQCVPAPCIQDFKLNAVPSEPFLASMIGKDRHVVIAGVGAPDPGVVRAAKGAFRPFYRKAYSGFLALRGRRRIRIAYG
jgi:glycosyl transferase family 25